MQNRYGARSRSEKQGRARGLGCARQTTHLVLRSNLSPGLSAAPSLGVRFLAKPVLIEICGVIRRHPPLIIDHSKANTVSPDSSGAGCLPLKAGQHCCATEAEGRSH